MQSLTNYIIKCRISHLVDHKGNFSYTLGWREKNMVNYHSLKTELDILVEKHK